jgi:hexosaminidase
MKNKFIPIAIIGLFLSIISFGQHTIDIIPQPVSVKLDKSSIFVYNNNTKIICNVNSKEYSVAEYLRSKLQVFNYSIKPILAKRDNPKYNMANSIIFILSSDKKLGKEGYQIDILKDRIVLSANENAGFFYGCQTLIQMIMPSNPY